VKVDLQRSGTSDALCHAVKRSLAIEMSRCMISCDRRWEAADHEEMQTKETGAV
jgi:hypothetical protein